MPELLSASSSPTTTPISLPFHLCGLDRSTASLDSFSDVWMPPTFERSQSNEAVDLSNPHKWKGKLIGVVVGDEEAESSSGTIYTRPYVSYVCSADRIKDGNFKVPKLKKLESASPKPLATTELPDSFSAAEDDIPF